MSRRASVREITKVIDDMVDNGFGSFIEWDISRPSTPELERDAKRSAVVEELNKLGVTEAKLAAFAITRRQIDH